MSCVYAFLRCLYSLLVLVDVLRYDDGHTDIQAIIGAICWAFLESFRYVIWNSVTFALMQRSTGVTAILYSLAITLLLSIGLGVSIVFCIIDRNFIGFIAFCSFHVALYIGILYHIRERQRPRWNFL
eukprot:UN23659